MVISSDRLIALAGVWEPSPISSLPALTAFSHVWMVPSGIPNSDQVTCWLTGYSQEELNPLVESGITYGDFFRNAPAPNPNRKLITGSICGVKVETIEDPLMQEIRYLDKLVDELAKGKAMEKVLRK